MVQTHFIPRRAFTVIEMLVVVGILLVLLAVTLIAINPSKQFATTRDRKRQSDLLQIGKAIGQYTASNKGRLPVDIPLHTTGMALIGSSTGQSPEANALCGLLVPQYLPAFPHDPDMSGDAITNCLTNHNTGYYVTRDDKNQVALYALTATPAIKYGQIEPGSDPMAWWKFDENTGTTAADASGRGNTGTLTNGPTWTSGKSGSAVSFGGVNHVVTVPDSSSLDITTGGTLEAWVYANALSGGVATPRIIDKWHGTGNQRSYQMYLATTDKLGIEMSADGIATSVGIRIDNAITTGRWYHFAVTYDGSTVRLYLDGIPQTSTASLASIYISTTNIGIGSDNVTATTNPFNGVIDDVRIYDYARSRAQILDDMAQFAQN